MKKVTLKIQDLKKKSNSNDQKRARVIDALLTKNLKGGIGDPPPIGPCRPPSY